MDPALRRVPAPVGDLRSTGVPVGDVGATREAGTDDFIVGSHN